MNIPHNELIEALDNFYLQFPREVGWKTQQGFVRNRYARNAEHLAEKLEDIRTDFFASVYSFEDDFTDGKQWDRSKVVINRMFFDFDCPEAKVVERLKLKTCDTQVFEIARLSRVPFSIHGKTELPCTPISAFRFMRMSFNDVIRFVKRGNWDVPEAELDGDFAETLEIADYFIHEEQEEKTRATQELPESIRTMLSERMAKGRKARIAYYVEVLRKHGKLSADEKIREIHLKSKWIAQHGVNEGAVEHIARVHLILMMIEEGWSDEQIHAVFRLAKDYDPKRTQYYIDYNRKWLSKKSNPS
jgi:hypothetical protein